MLASLTGHPSGLGEACALLSRSPPPPGWSPPPETVASPQELAVLAVGRADTEPPNLPSWW